MKNNKIIMFSSLLLVPLLLNLEAQASIYKCVNAKTEVYYNDKPCAAKDKEQEFNAVKDPVNGYIPPEALNNSSDNISNKTLSKKKLKNSTNKFSNDNTNSQSANKVEEQNESAASNGNSENKTENNGDLNILSTKSSSAKETGELIFH